MGAHCDRALIFMILLTRFYYRFNDIFTIHKGKCMVYLRNLYYTNDWNVHLPQPGQQ